MINPKVWGKHGWVFLHLVSLSYPEKPSNKEKKNFKQFFELLQDILPCEVCQDNYKDHLNKYPLSDNVFQSKENLVNWLIDIHNCVNKMNNSKIYNYDEATQILKQIQQENLQQCNPTIKTQQNYFLLVIIAICIIIIYYLLSKKK